MAMETREEYLESMRSQEAPDCPHCGRVMTIWETPPFSFSDGMGWCAPYLFVCFNDDCPLFVNGWKEMEENFGQTASQRCICYRGAEDFQCMPVFSPTGAKGMIINDQRLMEEAMLRENTKRGFALLADCYVEKDGVAVFNILTDSCQPPRVRLKAAEMLSEIAPIEAADTLKALTFENELIQKQADESYTKILERHFARECPHCRGIIKSKAKLCKHCGESVVA